MRRRLAVVFDLDGVLVPIRSSWEYLHRYFGVYDERLRRANIELFYNGLITYEEWMCRDLALLASRGCIHRHEIVQAFREVKLNDGAEYACECFRSIGAELAIVSGGVNVLAELVGSKLGIKRIYANKLLFDEHGCLLPYGIKVVNPLMKDMIIRALSKELDIPLRNFVYVGDTTWDTSAFKVVNYPVVYNCDECKEVLAGLGVRYYEVKSLYELAKMAYELL